MRSFGATHSTGCLAACWLASAIGSAWAAPRVTLETVDEQVVGQLVRFDEMAITLGGDTFARVPRDEVLVVRFEPELMGRERSTPRTGEVVLTDGSRLGYETFEIVGDSVRLIRDDGVALLTKTEAIRHWRLVPSDAEGVGIEEEGPASDRLLVKSRRGEGITSVDGVVLGVSEEGVRFAIDGAEGSEPVVAPWGRLAAIRFFRPDNDDAAAEAVVTLRGGDRVVAERFDLPTDRGLRLRSHVGLQGVVPLDRVAAIDLSSGRVRAVETLELVQSDWRPYFKGSTGRRGYALGESLTGEAIRLRFPDHRLPQGWPDVAETREFDRGIALRSRGNLRFALPAETLRLKGWVGLEPLAVRAGSAVVSVHADERLLWSGVIDGSTRPTELNEAILGERTLTLRVDYGDNLDAGDRVQFAALRVVIQ